jgi:hypothetical protein
VQVLHPSQKFKRPPFLNGCSYSIEHYGVEVVTFNGMTSLLNFIKIYQLVQKLMGGRQTDMVYKQSTVEQQLTTLNLNNFKMIEAMGLKIIA